MDADADLVRNAVASGRFVPFGRVLTTVGRLVPGEVVDVVVLDHPPSAVAYQVTVLTANGTVRKAIVDAQTGTVTAVH